MSEETKTLERPLISSRGSPRQPASIAHNQGETPLFAASIERAALRN